MKQLKETFREIKEEYIDHTIDIIKQNKRYVRILVAGTVIGCLIGAIAGGTIGSNIASHFASFFLIYCLTTFACGLGGASLANFIASRKYEWNYI